jgi:hypothetical protein
MASSEGVGGASDPAADALERRWVGAIASVDQPAVRAGPRGVAGIDQHDRHPCQSRRVHDNGGELMGRPTVLDAPLGLATRDPLADAREIFPRTPASGVLGRRTQPLGDPRVDIGGPPRFLPPPLRPQARRR